MTEREKLVELVNNLFIYTDQQNWQALQNEVFTERVYVDMTSLGGDASELTAVDICKMWAEGFAGIDAINHLGGNYLVDIHSDEEASVFAYATATHYKAAAEHGQTREFVGTYDLEMKRMDENWRITSFTYQLKYVQGNLELK